MRIRLTCALAASLALVSCGGGGGSAPSTSALGPVLPSQHNAVPASVVIHIPARASSAWRPAYISPATQSVSIAISPGAGCSGCSASTTIKANLTPTSPGCSGSGGATSCTIPMQLNPGSYTANVATYDQTGEAGNQLSANQSVPFTIVVNTANTINMALNGVPATATYALSGTYPATFASGTLTIDGINSSANILVSTKDADGNAIIGAGAPTIASAVVTGNTNFTTLTSGNNFNVKTPAKGSRTPATITVTLSAPNCPGAAVCSTSITANMTEFIAVAEHGNNLTQVYSERTQTWTTGVAGSGPYVVAFDSKGNLFVANQTAGTVSEFAPPYAGSATTTMSGTYNTPDSLALDSNDNLFIGALQGIGSAMIEYAPPYTGTPTSFTGPFVFVDNIFVDSSNNVWVTDDSASGDSYIFPAPANPTTSVTIPVTQCDGITQDGAGDVDLSCASDNHIHAYTMAGAAVNTAAVGEAFHFLYPYPGGAQLDVIGSGGSSITQGAAYYNFQANTFNTINTNGPAPKAMAIDASKLMYVTDYSDGNVLTLPFPYTGTASILMSGLTNPYGVAIWP